VIRLAPTQPFGGGALRGVGRSLFFGLALTPALWAAQEFGTPLSTVYTADDIGADPMGWVAVQDGTGTMHFGCNSLVSFDGDHWRSSPIGDTYALRGLDVAPNGRLWAAAVDEVGWFQTEGAGDWEYHSLRSFLPPAAQNLGEVWNAFAVPAGAVFVSHDRVLWWNGRTFAVANLPGTRRLLAMRTKGEVFVHHIPTGLYRVDRGTLELVIPAAALSGLAIVAAEARTDGGWTLLTSRGVAIFRAGRLTLLDSEVSAFMRGDSLTAVVRIPDGRLAIGTLKSGLILTDAGAARIEHRWGAATGLPTNEVFSLACDREGGLWVTSASAIIRLNPASENVLFNQGNGLPDGPYLASAPLGEKIAIATDEQLLLCDPAAQTITPLTPARGHIWALQPGPGGIFVARSRGLDWLTEAGTQTVFQGEDDVFAVRPARAGRRTLWASTGRQVVQWDRRSGAIRSIAANLPDIVASLAEGPDARLWCGTTNAGVLAVPLDGRGGVQRVGPESGLPGKIGPVVVTATSDGTVLALSPKGGWILDPVREHFSPLTDYPARRIGAYAIPSEGGLAWLVHPAESGLPACVAAVRLRAGRGRWTPYAVEGLWKIGTPTSLYAAPLGRRWALWVGGTAGLLRLELDPTARPGPVTPPLITVWASSRRAPAYRPVRAALSYAQRDLRMEFGIPSYSHRPALRLETRLDGIDPDWIALAAPFTRDLPALGEGRYRVLARTIDADGRQSAETASAFVILPPWWRSWPVEGGLALGVLALGALLFRWRLRALQHRTVALEAMVRSRTEQIMRADQAKTDFVAHISHNIRNPLNGLLGMTVALEDTRLSSRQRQMLGVMKSCGNYLATLIDNVIDFAKIEAGQIELELTAVGVAEVLDQVAEVLRGSGELAKRDLVITVAVELPPTLVTDPSRLKEILVNYGTNAVKYAEGRIELGARRIRSRRDEVEFFVRDHGPGLAMDTQAVLFTRFGRLPAPPGRRPDSSGLGLFVCQRLAEAMGGAVGVESRPGHGARFFVRLPLLAAAPTAAAPPGPLPFRSILLVEDTDYNAWAVAAVLARLGLRLAARARTGREALQLLRQAEYDLILLDRSLPDMEGNEVARAFRAREQPGRHALIVAVTAYSTAQDQAATLAAGMDAFVGKPLTPEKLRSVLGLASGGAATPDRESVGDGLRLDLFRELSDGSAAGCRAEQERYLAHLVADADQLRAVLAAADPSGIRLAAHRLVAAAGMVEATALADLAAALERAAGERTAEEAARLGPEVLAATAELVRRLREPSATPPR